MKPSAFELAAIEARDGVKDIDAELERLNARKQALEAKRELLESLARQLLAVAPTGAEANAADQGSQSGTSSEAPKAVQPAIAQGVPKSIPPSARKDEWSLYIAASAQADSPEADQPSVVDLLSQGKGKSIRAEGFPTIAPANGRGIREVLP